jgi:hypothetical protein
MTGFRYQVPNQRRPLSPPAVVIIVGLGILWFAAFLSAAGVRRFVPGLMVALAGIGIGLGSSYVLGLLCHGGQWTRQVWGASQSLGGQARHRRVDEGTEDVPAVRQFRRRGGGASTHPQRQRPGQGHGPRPATLPGQAGRWSGAHRL